MSEKAVRAFISIELPDEIIKEILRIQEIIQKKAPKFIGKLTEPENLHITLKFLGEITPELTEKIKSRLAKINFLTLDLKLSYVGTFTHKKNPKIVWIKVIGSIFALQKQIDESLSALFTKEKRFMSHLTIARIKYVKDKKSFINYIKKIKISPLKFQINKFSFNYSELTSQGPIYNTLEEYNVQENEKCCSK